MITKQTTWITRQSNLFLCHGIFTFSVLFSLLPSSNNPVSPSKNVTENHLFYVKKLQCNFYRCMQRGIGNRKKVRLSVTCPVFTKTIYSSMQVRNIHSFSYNKDHKHRPVCCRHRHRSQRAKNTIQWSQVSTKLPGPL